MTTATMTSSHIDAELRTAPSAPRVLLHLEGLAAFVGALVAYRHLGGGVGLFLALFLVPDLSMLGYARGPRVGAAAYNAAHSYVGPALLATLGLFLGAHGALIAAAIWVAHIGLDRALGYGLKYGTAFRDTHLGRA
jgi:hypothetical protein